ncbi:DUF4083 family protein [Bacillus alkalicellulosilyticus]|uniref:DUF4083 family protein n=1 Tax=Alkalihalobacterium alkalicellulosilyticum TaxID=1912214 RepID=UPI000996DFFA|nr:DUF4083 family protein [Bacillus alkalicellulosilyticus]
MSISFGTMLYQLFSFAFIGLIIFGIIFFIRSIKLRNKQIATLEKKIDQLDKKVSQNKIE